MIYLTFLSLSNTVPSEIIKLLDILWTCIVSVTRTAEIDTAFLCQPEYVRIGQARFIDYLVNVDAAVVYTTIIQGRGIIGESKVEAVSLLVQFGWHYVNDLNIFIDQTLQFGWLTQPVHIPHIRISRTSRDVLWCKFVTHYLIIIRLRGKGIVEHR